MSKNAQTAADRYRAWRERRQAGLLILPVPVNPSALARALRSRNIIATDAQMDRAALANHVSALVETWAAETEER
jgi:hypothetical protein